MGVLLALERRLLLGDFGEVLVEPIADFLLFKGDGLLLGEGLLPLLLKAEPLVGDLVKA